MNKVKIPKKCGIGECITQDVIKEEMINVAGQRILSQIRIYKNYNNK